MHSLLKGLVLFGYDELARQLQQALEEALQLIERSLPEIWTTDLQQNPANPVGACSLMAVTRDAVCNLHICGAVVSFIETNPGVFNSDKL